jgi:hypothetical protein
MTEKERYATDEVYREKIKEKNRNSAKKNRKARTAAQRARRDKRRDELRQHLGGCCVGCGATEGLQFDHIDRTKKSFTISKCLDYGWDTLVEEADKCQLLCYTCHEYKSLINHDKDKLAEGYRVVSVDTIGDEVIIRLRR